MTSTNITGNAGALQGRAALVVGASRGIGAATARAMAGAGAAVVLAARDAKRLDDVAASIRADGGTATVVPTDITEAGAVKRLVGRCLEEHGRLDVAVNGVAAGGRRPTPVADSTSRTSMPSSPSRSGGR